MLEGEVIPVKEIMPFTEFFGFLFDKYYNQFYEAHKGEFEEFLKTNGLTDAKLERAGTSREELSKEFCAVQMSYYLFRYSGLLNVRYTRVEDREELKKKTEVVAGPPIKTEDMKGERFGLMLTDITSGREYRRAGSLETFSTFGDCDETAFLIAQGIEALNVAHGMKMEVSLVPMANHTQVGVKFKGLSGVYRVDPTMLAEGMKGGKYPEKPFGKTDLEKVVMNEEPDEREYREVVIPRLDKKIGQKTTDTVMHIEQAERIETAVAAASSNSYTNLNFAFAAMRVLMNEGRRKDPETLRKIERNLQMLTDADPTIIDITNKCIAALGNDYQGRLAMLQEAQKGLGTTKCIEMLKIVTREMIKGEKMEVAIKSTEPKRVRITG